MVNFILNRIALFFIERKKNKLVNKIVVKFPYGRYLNSNSKFKRNETPFYLPMLNCICIGSKYYWKPSDEDNIIYVLNHEIMHRILYNRIDFEACAGFDLINKEGLE